MRRYILKRVLYMILCLLAVITITFFMIHAIPGDPVTSMVQDLPEETRNAYLHRYGFDRPVIVQYFLYMKQIFLGDLGESLRYPGRKVAQIATDYSPVSALVGGIALLVGAGLGLLCGVVAALHHDKVTDRIVMILSLLGTTIPTFVIASILQYTLSVRLRLFPTTGYRGVRYLVLPVLSMCLGPFASYARYMRSSMLDVSGQDYCLAARARGIRPVHIVFRYMFRNAMLPCIVMLSVSVANIFSGSFIVESIYALPGLGRYFITAITDRDYYVVLGLNIILTGIFLISMMISDILLMALDPRLRRPITEGSGEV